MTPLSVSRPIIPAERVALARPNVFEIDLGAIARFAGEIRDAAGPNVTLFAALKSNAYGFGLVEVARTVVGAGFHGLAVVDRAHAIMLRRNGMTAPILVYAGNVMDAEGARADQEFDLIPTITQRAVAELYSRLATRPIRMAVKVDTGQERMGVLDTEAVEFVRAMTRLPNLEPYIVCAHPNVPADAPDTYLEWQYRRFLKVCEALDREKISVPVKMFASSKVLSRTSSMMLTGIDPGQMLFGLHTPQGSTAPRAFRALKSRLVHIRPIARTEFLDQAPFPVRAGMRMGVIPMGTSDGIASLHCGEVLVRGCRAKILGKPSLEYTRIDLTDIAGAEIGDEVVIIGPQGQSEIAQEEVVAHQSLGGRAELAMAVRSTIPRRYIG